MGSIIGRDYELQELNDLYKSNKAQFIAVYGRRRVGKTFLIDEAFTGRITFRHAGLSPVDEGGKANLLKNQLKHFYNSLLLHGMKRSHQPTSWNEAFFMLEQHLRSIDDGRRQVVFIDELPWMDTPRSGFITALEGYWNAWACHRSNMMLVVCGSATSWMQDNLINNHGGLYGRTTYEVKLSPFMLHECEQMYKSNGIRMSRYDMVQSYMMVGGIPYYLTYFDKKLSLAQNIDHLFFDKNAKLRGEYDRLFASVFSKPEEMKNIVEFLSSRRAGRTRQEIIQHMGMDVGGELTKMLRALIASDFVMRYIPFGESKRNEHYKLIDPFCLFYLRFVKGHDSLTHDIWSHSIQHPSVISWRGYAFEDLCLYHIKQIKIALGISGVSTTQSAWSIKGAEEESGTQIDLLINRKDNVVNMCEMKFYNDDFRVTGEYDRKLKKRENILAEQLPKTAAIHPTLVTTYGLAHGEYSGAFVDVVTMDSLFVQ